MDKVFEDWPGHIFVFGSNLAGIHGGGAARWAYRWCKAHWEVGVGIQGNSYAIPTKNEQLATLPLEKIKPYVDQFLEFAKANPYLDFFVTRIGCGLAGYNDRDIAPMFEDVPVNVELPHKWGKKKDPMVIDGFFGPHRYLSNFWPCDVSMYDITYPSVEHAYQAAKTMDVNYQKTIRDAESPMEAKQLGKSAVLRPDWEQVKVDFMRYLVWNKFSEHEDLKTRLLGTGQAQLVEGNGWGDTFWGVCKGQGQNWLGRLLMETRDRLRAMP